MATNDPGRRPIRTVGLSGRLCFSKYGNNFEKTLTRLFCSNDPSKDSLKWTDQVGDRKFNSPDCPGKQDACSWEYSVCHLPGDSSDGLCYAKQHLSVCGCREERTSSPLLYIFKMIFIKNFFIIFLNVFKNNKKISLFFK